MNWISLRHPLQNCGPLAPIVAGAVVWLLVGCGGEPEPAPTPAPPTVAATTAPAPSVATDADAPAPASPLAAAAPAMPSAALQATPTVSVPQVIEEDNACAVEYDLDLAGYPDLKLKMGCALSAAKTDPVAINEFGQGPDYSRFMLWFGEDKQIFVLFPDQSWQAYNDTWDDSQPEITCNPLSTAPKSPPLPRRGFGKLWCSVDGLQEKLGTTDREERLCQHTVVQSFEQGRLLACFEDATIRYFRLLNDGTWDLSIVK